MLQQRGLGPINPAPMVGSKNDLGPNYWRFESMRPANVAVPLCAHPASKTVALGSYGTGKQIACTESENQHHSKFSYLVLKASAATVNRRVATAW